MVNASCWPCVIPAPHLAGSVQVITPPVSVQPWLVSRFLALAGLNGYGPWLALDCWFCDTHWLAGVPGIAPPFGTAYPRQIAVLSPGWSITICSACRMYSCLKMGPVFWLFMFGTK